MRFQYKNGEIRLAVSPSSSVLQDTVTSVSLPLAVYECMVKVYVAYFPML